MVITGLEIENWKCYSKEKFSFLMHNIINKPNGTGKTSMFEAIIFGLYGKIPPGFNLNTVRNDSKKPCKILVRFEHEGSTYECFRNFGSSSYVAIKKNGETVASSSREAFSYIDAIIPWNIISVLWGSGTLVSSNILKPQFLVDHLLNYIFEEPKYLLKHYSYELYTQNKVVKGIMERIGDKKDVEKEIEAKIKEQEDIKKHLKEKQSSNKENVAKLAKDAHEKLNSQTWDIERMKDDVFISQYQRLVGRNDPERVKKELLDRLEREKSKENSDLLEINTAAIVKIKRISENNSKCLICDSEWIKEYSDKLDKAINNPSARDEDMIKSIEDRIAIIDSAKPEDIAMSIEYKRLKERVASCPDWKSILNKIDKKNEQLWIQFDKLNKEIQELGKIADLKKSLIEEQTKSENISKRVNMISAYIKHASEHYSKALTKEASNILSSISSRYDSIFLDEGSYKVSVISSDMKNISLLPAIQLSNGEKTLIGASLILAAHKLFFSGVSLLFDESFSALDKENIMELKKYFSKVGHQIFIITHDNRWAKE